MGYKTIVHYNVDLLLPSLIDHNLEINENNSENNA